MFSNIVHAGQDIKPWLMTGPDFVSMGDVLTERSYFENPDANVGEEAVEQAIAGFSAALQGVIPRETDEITYPYDIKAKWRFLGTPEVYNGFGKYFVTNSLGVVVASCIVYSEKEQSTKMNLFSRWKNRLRLLVNGEVVIDNLELVQVRSKGNFPKEGIVHLKAGANVFNIISMRVSRRVEVGWRLEVLEAEAPLRVETLINMEEDLREELEHAYQKTHMKADTYAEGDDVRMVLGSSRVAQVHITAKDDKGNKVLDLYPESAGELVLLAKAAVGIYTIHVSWMVDEDIMAEKDFSVQVCQVLEPLLGYENYKKRQQIFMRSCADMDVIEAYRESPNVLWCRYALGEYDRITYSMVDFACGFTDRWEDCADFALLPLLMIVYEEQIDAKLPPRYVERIKQAALKFKYWVDEANDSVMWMDSENHRMGFHTLEYLAGILFPQDIFVNSGQNGLFHSIKGRMHLMEWLSQRIRFGYNEFHSDSYLPVTFAPLMVIQKVAPYEEFSLRTMAKELADITVFHLAANNYNGCIASPRGRSYNLPMRNPMQQGTTSILYILFGRDRAAMNPTPGATAAAVSDYMPPEGICNVAYDYSEMVNYYKTGFYHWGNQNANLTAMRTPEYMMSSARNHNLGRCEDHLHVAQVTMPRDIILFFSAPYTRQEGSGLRPDYWAGQYCAPEVYQYRNTLNVSWRHVTDPLIWMTHCHFEAEKFDEVVYQGQWIFGRVEDSFVGIWSENPCELAQEGNYTGRELISEGRNNNWIVECGSKREDGSFADFMEKLSASSITVEENKVIFASPKNGCMEFCKNFAVGGELVPIRSMAVDSKYMKSIFGSGTYEYHMEGMEGHVWSYASSI